MNARLRHTMLLLPISLLVLLAAACGSAAPADSEPEAASLCGGSLENCYAYDGMPQFLDAVTGMVSQFFDEAYPDLPRPRRVIYVASDQVGRSACGNVYSGSSYEYCSANDSIYIGQDLLWSFYKLGDAAPVLGLAHEWGHHVQAYLRLPPPRSARDSIRYENQADCLAGAWATYADEKGWLEEKDDLADIEGLMRSIGSREGARRDHGTTVERVAAFQAGFKTGLKGCNSYSPATPVLG